MLDSKIDPDEYEENDYTAEELEQLKEDAEIDRQIAKYNL